MILRLAILTPTMYVLHALCLELGHWLSQPIM
jgi:hypothetical protein